MHYQLYFILFCNSNDLKGNMSETPKHNSDIYFITSHVFIIVISVDPFLQVSTNTIFFALPVYIKYNHH